MIPSQHETRKEQLVFMLKIPSGCVACQDLGGPVWAHWHKQPSPGQVTRRRAGSLDSNSSESRDAHRILQPWAKR